MRTMMISAVFSAAVRTCYRHVQQAEPWCVTPMAIDAGGGHAVIPAEYTGTPYPLEYYFELSDDAGRWWLYPGLGPNLADQPYFVLRSSRDGGGEQGDRSRPPG